MGKNYIKVKKKRKEKRLVNQPKKVNPRQRGCPPRKDP